MDSQEKTSKKRRRLLYLSGFLFAFHTALPTYVYSSFLGDLAGVQSVGAIYAFSSLLSIISFFFAPKVLRAFGNYKVTMITLSLELISLIGMAYFQSNQTAVILLFIVNFVSIAAASFNLDIFLEGLSSNKDTGSIRGSYLTLSNAAWVFAPITAGYILSDSGYFKVLLFSSIFSIPLFLIFKMGFENFKDSQYKNIPVFKTIGEILQKKDLRKIFAVSFLLQFFYSMMVIYTPIYLFETIKFSWSEIGVIFSIMLLPFVLTEFPLGKISDKFFGEKEILSLGFVLTAISTGLIYFLDTPNFVLWTIILFMTRIGASMIEIMSETYFFKITNANDTDVISMFRTMRPFGYVVAPLAATAILAIADFRFLFLILGLIMLYGLRFSLTIKDTN